MEGTALTASQGEAPQWEIRMAAASDYSEVARLFDRSPGASSWSAEDLAGYVCLVAACTGEIVGAAVARQVAEGEAELLNLAVYGRWRRQGVAQALIRQLFLFLHGEWFLEVGESNSAAIHLYDSLGFKPISKRKAYYTESGEGAIVMRRSAW